MFCLYNYLVKIEYIARTDITIIIGIITTWIITLSLKIKRHVSNDHIYFVISFLLHFINLILLMSIKPSSELLRLIKFYILGLMVQRGRKLHTNQHYNTIYLRDFLTIIIVLLYFTLWLRSDTDIIIISLLIGLIQGI